MPLCVLHTTTSSAANGRYMGSVHRVDSAPTVYSTSGCHVSAFLGSERQTITFSIWFPLKQRVREALKLYRVRPVRLHFSPVCIVLDVRFDELCLIMIWIFDKKLCMPGGSADQLGADKHVGYVWLPSKRSSCVKERSKQWPPTSRDINRNVT